MSDTSADPPRRALLPAPGEVAAFGTGPWPIESVHELLTVLNAELLHLLHAMPTDGHDTVPTGDGTCTVCGPHLAALEEHQRHRQAVFDYLVVRARAAHWGRHGSLTEVARRSLAKSETALRNLVSSAPPPAVESEPGGP
jgi:hypothetical protein